MLRFSKVFGLALLFFFGVTSCELCAVTAEEFFKKAKKLDSINAFAATCHSAHETGYWTSQLWKTANNGAGIKADKNWLKAKRPAVKRNSNEVVGGKTVSRVSYFRAYSSIDDFLSDYKFKITNDYPLAARHSDTMWGYFSSLQKGRNGSWATTNRYFEYLSDKAVRLAPKLLGKEWRSQLLKDYKRAKSRRLLSAKETAIVEKRLAALGIKLR